MITQISEKVSIQLGIAKDKVLAFLLGYSDDFDNQSAEKQTNQPPERKVKQSKNGGNAVPSDKPASVPNKNCGTQSSGKWSSSSAAIERTEDNWLELFQKMFLEQKKDQQNNKIKK